MLFFKKHIAPIYTGMANGRFIQRKYEKALVLYEKACRIDPSTIENKNVLSCIGRCYLALGKHNDAYTNLYRSYGLYKKTVPDFKNAFEKKEYISLIKAYVVTLEKIGKGDEAMNVKKETGDIYTEQL